MGKYTNIEREVENKLNVCLDILSDINKYNNDSQVIIDEQKNSFKNLMGEHVERCSNEISSLEDMIDSKKNALRAEARKKDAELEEKFRQIGDQDV